MIKLQKTKFDDDAKARFIEEYRKHARTGDAARAAGVTTLTVNRHISDDQEFAEACLAAENEYRDRLIKHHQDIVFNGTVKRTFDKNGNLIAEETVYNTRLIELELKKHDEGYRDKREVKMDHSGGVLIAPAQMESIDDWEDKFSGQTIDVEKNDEESS